ncbi:MAG: site-2 protease family protein [Oscillospiraceae bacterium]|nr:site-2 protease family protein [Oscillospiraceae bacterium]
MNGFIGAITQEDLMGVFVRLFIVLMILPLHEYAHAWTAHKLGDDTAMYQGRLTLNPLVHIDPVGALCLLIGGFGWAKPVPIDPTRFSRKHSMRFGVAITALAGPVSNLIAGYIGMIIYRLFIGSKYYMNYLMAVAGGESVKNSPMLLATMLSVFVTVNIGLAVFNLIPVPPLDGSKIVSYFTSPKVDRWFQQNQQIISIVFLFLVVSPVLGRPISFVSEKIFGLFVILTNWVPVSV